MAFMKNMQASARSLADNGIFNIAGDGAPTSGTSGTGVGVAGPGSLYFDKTNARVYVNFGTAASPTWNLTLGSNIGNLASGTITAAQIISTAAGDFGHANGVPLVAAQGAHNVIQIKSVILKYDFSVAAYTAGGNITVNNSGGGAALTGLVSAANSVGAAADKAVVFFPLTAAGNAMVENGGINLVSSAAFTNPGTAAGVIRWVAEYSVHPTGF